jgi:hypothetical protein
LSLFEKVLWGKVIYFWEVGSETGANCQNILLKLNTMRKTFTFQKAGNFGFFILCTFLITILSCTGTSEKKDADNSTMNESNTKLVESEKKSLDEVSLPVKETSVETAPENVWETLSFKNYTINIPGNKRMVKNSPEGNFTLYLLSEQTDNIMMQINDLAGYMLTLDSYSFQFSDEYFRRTNVNLIEDKRINVNNQPCHKFVATADDGHGEIEYKTMVYIWVKNNWAYNLTFTAKPDTYNELKPIAEKVFASFTLKK